MKAWLSVMAALVVTGWAAAPDTELPESDDYQSFEVEPPLLLPNRSIESDKALPAGPINSVAQLEKQVERAKRAAADAELLFKRGVLSKMEVEQRALRVIRKQADLENARFEQRKADYAVQHTRFEMGQISKEALVALERELAQAKQTAETALANRQRAEIEAAETNLRRQRKLAELGSARASDVSRAEQRLADLKAGKP